MRHVRIMMVVFSCVMVFCSVLYLDGQDRLGILRDVNQPEMMAVYGNELFVLDGIKIRKYRLDDLSPLGVFGSEGSGPGEFRVDFMNRLRLQVLSGMLVVSDFNKAALFTREGQFVREIRTPFGVSQLVPLPDGLVVTRFITGENGNNQMGVVLLDQNLNEKKRLYTKPEIDVRRSGKLDAPNEMIFLMSDAERIYLADQAKLRILVFDHRGNELPGLSLERKAQRLSGEYRAEVMQWFDDNWEGRFKGFAQSRNLSRESMREMIFFHEFFPAFRSVSLADDLFLMELFQKKEGKSTFLVMNKKGQLLRETWLTDSEPGRVKMFPAVTFAFYNGYCYYTRENLDEDCWELFCEKY